MPWDINQKTSPLALERKYGGNALVVIVGAQFLEKEPTETEAVPTVPETKCLQDLTILPPNIRPFFLNGIQQGTRLDPQRFHLLQARKFGGDALKDMNGMTQ